MGTPNADRDRLEYVLGFAGMRFTLLEIGEMLKASGSNPKPSRELIQSHHQYLKDCRAKTEAALEEFEKAMGSWKE